MENKIRETRRRINEKIRDRLTRDQADSLVQKYNVPEYERKEKREIISKYFELFQLILSSYFEPFLAFLDH